MLLRRIKQSLYINILLGVLVAPGIVYAGTYDDFLFAVRFDDGATVQALIKNGADVNSVESERGESALMISIRENSNKVFNDLLASPDINLEARAKNGDTALMLACFLGRKDDVSKLLAKGAKVNQSGWAPLHYAAANGDITIISELLKHDAKIDIQAPNGTTPLIVVVAT